MSVFVDIEKRLGDFHLKVAFEAENEILALLGASGCGKSMTLKCIAGIERPDRGRIVVDGTTLFDSEQHIDLSPQKRRTGLMFQNYALFPNMTVLQNIRAGARREPDKAKREAMTTRLMERFQLQPLARHYPSQLSGGQQQRVALARILISDPQILLLDEPFSALDQHLRFRLERDVHETLRSFGKTAILVSHDRDEVYRLADRIVVIDHGKIETAGLKKDVFRAPKTRAAAVLTGCKNISRAAPLPGGLVEATDWGLTLKYPGFRGACIGIRMHNILPGHGENEVLCDVAEITENPFSFTVMLRPEGRTDTVLIGWEMTKELWNTLRADRLWVHFPSDALLALEETEETA